MPERADVVVGGGGVAGLAAAWALARAGREPVVLEQFRVGHTRGSSHGATRIFRLAYEEVEWVRLAQDALALWREVERGYGEQVLDLTGLVDLPVEPSRLTATLDACGTAYELLDAAEVERRFGLATTCDEAVFQPEAGVVLADRALPAFRAGLDVREQTPVRSLVPGTDGVAVRTEEGAIEARAAVVAAGAWAKPLLAGAGIDLPVAVTRETVAYFRLADERAVPSVIDYRDGETYALTAGPGLLKVGVHHSGLPADPDDPGGAPDAAISGRAAGWAARSFPLARPGPESVETCLYTTTADTRFVLERHGPIVVCSACSGHGFKFAPAVGVRAAALAGRAQ
jgi:monomeric sarcosine oxidase